MSHNNKTKISQIHIKHFQYPPRQIPYPQRYPTPPGASGPNHRPNHPWPPPANSHAHPNHPTSPHQSPVHAPSPSPQPPQPANSPHQVNNHTYTIKQFVRRNGISFANVFTIRSRRKATMMERRTFWQNQSVSLETFNWKRFLCHFLWFFMNL